MTELSRRHFMSVSLGTAVAGGLVASGAPSSCASGPGPRTGAQGNHSGEPDHPKRDLRGVWVASVTNIDWPSKTGLSAVEQQAELRGILDDAVDIGLNAVYLQVRPTADAFFRSNLEPWSAWLSGTQGVDPGYDPLAFAVREAHARNLELHAWMNPYRISISDDVDTLVPNHPARLHPDWVVSYGGELYYNPGLPEVRAFDVRVITDMVRRYDIDGVHFDDYFYPYPVEGEEFDDADAFAAYGEGFRDVGDWRRDNINRLVHELDTAIHAIKPWIKWGISPFGIWRNDATDRRGSATDGLQSYDAIYADSYTWVRRGWVDYITPQLYWPIGLEVADYAVLVAWWSELVRGTDVQLTIGQDIANIGVKSPTRPQWMDPEEMPKHLVLNEEYPEVAGNVWFSMSVFATNPLGFTERLKKDFYRYPALAPVMKALHGSTPRPTALVSARAGTAGVTLSWLDEADRHGGHHGQGHREYGDDVAYYAVYRFDGWPRQRTRDFDDARHLLGTVRAAGRGGRQSWTDSSAERGRTYSYYVSAVSRLDHESRPSNPQLVRAR